MLRHDSIAWRRFVPYDDLLMMTCTIFVPQLKVKGARTKSSFQARPLVEREGGSARAGLKCHTVGLEPPLPHFFNNDEFFRSLFKLWGICVFSRSCWESFSQHLDKHWRVSPLRSSQSIPGNGERNIRHCALSQGVSCKISIGSLLWVEMFTAPVLLWTYCPTVGSRMLNIQMFTAPQAKGCLLIITRSITSIIWIVSFK